MKPRLVLFSSLLLAASSCSPLKSSPNDEKHQLELTLHEVQTNLDDLRHDINCFQTELQILDGRIKYYENAVSSLKNHDLEKQQAKLEQLSSQIESLERKWSLLDQIQKGEVSEIKDLSSHANETSASLAQFRDRINDLEKDIYAQNRKFDEIGKIRKNIDLLSKGLQARDKTYKVKAGDSLEKIARITQTSVEAIKELNQLEQDLIVIGQELKIPPQ